MDLFLFDRYCAFCHNYRLNRSEWICAACHDLLPWIVARCQHCGLSLPQASHYCGRCSKKRFCFDQLFAPFHYAFPLQKILHQFKYQQYLNLGYILSRYLAKQLRVLGFDHGKQRPDVLLPLPLHFKKQRLRGYNQSIEIAQILSRYLAIPLHRNLLEKKRATRSQSQLPLPEPQKNIKDVFSVRYPQKMPQHVAIIDDVASSCSTVHEAAKTCKAAGAVKVNVWCVARASFK